MSRPAAGASPDWDESVNDGTLGVVMTPEVKSPFVAEQRA
jgi:hypothetical protein